MANGDGQQKPGLWARIDRQCRAFANFAWNKETREFMGRGGKSWGKLAIGLSLLLSLHSELFKPLHSWPLKPLSFITFNRLYFTFSAKIGLFYVAYYGFLAAFFCVCLAVFLTTLNDPGKGGPKSIQFLVGDSAPGNK